MIATINVPKPIINVNASATVIRYTTLHETKGNAQTTLESPMLLSYNYNRGFKKPIRYKSPYFTKVPVTFAP
jgi:hypothetical protein